jgi:hypothetical protein
VGVTSAEAVESAAWRTIEGDDGNTERTGAVEQVAKPLPRVAPFLPIVNTAEERNVVDRAFLATIEDLLLPRVNELDSEDDPAATRDGFEQIGGDALTGRVGVEVPHVHYVRGSAGTDEARGGHPAKRRGKLASQVAEVRMSK